MASNWLRTALCALFAVLVTARIGLAREVRFSAPVICKVQANVIVVDMNSPTIDVRPVVAGRVPAVVRKRSRKFTELVKVTRCLAAINGTFFDPRTSSTLGSMAYEGHLVQAGYVGNAVAVDLSNRAHYLRLTDTRGAGVDWTRYRFAVAAGPTLIVDGHIVVSQHGEGFHDPHLFRPARRSAIGFRENGEMLLVTVTKPVSLHHLARMMVALGARVAINLDGGSSTAMYYKGRVVVKPKGRLTNILAVLSRSSRSRRAPLPTTEELVPVEVLPSSEGGVSAPSSGVLDAPFPAPDRPYTGPSSATSDDEW